MGDDNIFKYITKYLNFYMECANCFCGKTLLTKKLLDDPCMICYELLIDSDEYIKSCNKCNSNKKIHLSCSNNNFKCPICRE